MKRSYAMVLISLALFVVAAFAQSAEPAAPASCPMMAQHEKVVKMAGELTASFDRVRAAKDEAARKTASDEPARLLADFQQMTSEPMACPRKQAGQAGGCGQGCCKMKSETAAPGCCTQGAGCCQGHQHAGGAGCCAGMAQTH